jgi:hypothetical protein
MAVRPDPIDALPIDRRSFYESFLEGLVQPFLGAGLHWIAAIASYAVLVAAILVAASYLPLIGIVIAFFAITSLIALSADFFRACFWVPAIGEQRVDRGPAFDLTRISQVYLKSGAHLTVFALVTQFPLVFFTIERLAEHASPLALLGDSTLWLLAVVPGYLWPIAIAMTALHNGFAAVWNVQAMLRAMYRAPVEYTLIVIFGVITFALTWVLMLMGGRAIGISGMLLAGTIGLPLALSHGVLGALLGHLLRARPDAFE